MLVIVDHVPALSGFTDLLWKLENAPLDEDDMTLLRRQQNEVRRVCGGAAREAMRARGLVGSPWEHPERFVIRASFTQGALGVE